MIKPTYTVSKLETFLRCEKEYELKYIWGIEAVSDTKATSHHTNARIFGILLHEIMQFLTWPDFKNEDTVISQALQNQQVTDNRFFEAIKNLLSKIKENKTWQTFMQASEKQNREVPFFWDAGIFYLKGTIDCLSFDGNSWTIVDYKTDRVKTEKESQERAQTYYGQMASYALAASHLLKVDQLETKLLFTSGPYVVSETWDSKKMREAKNIFEQTHKEIVSKNKTKIFNFPNDTQRCFHCPYFSGNYCGVKNFN